jgi:hypothetical protein
MSSNETNSAAYAASHALNNINNAMGGGVHGPHISLVTQGSTPSGAHGYVGSGQSTNNNNSSRVNGSGYFSSMPSSTATGIINGVYHQESVHHAILDGGGGVSINAAATIIPPELVSAS